MRVLNNSTLLEEIEYINKVLRSKKRGFKKIALEYYGVDDLELLEQLNVLGYVKVKNKVVRELNITNSNIEIIEPSRQVIEPIIKKNSKSIPSIKEDDNALAKIDNDKLKLLLDNLDHLLKLIPKHKNVIYRSNNNSNISLRLDSGLYKELKVRAERNNKTISEMLNLVLEQYLENNN